MASNNSMAPQFQVTEPVKKLGNVSIMPVENPTDAAPTASGGLYPVTPTVMNKPQDRVTPVGPTDGYGNATAIDQSAQTVDGKPTDRTPDYTGTPVANPTDAPVTTANPAAPVTTANPAAPVTTANPAKGLYDVALPKVPETTQVTVKADTGPAYQVQKPVASTTSTTAPAVNYDPRNEALVENRLESLMDPNSAVNRKAMSIAQQIAAQRGLQSSSIAAEAGTSALIDSARQIASQDANTYAQMQSQNQQYNQNWNINKDNQVFQSGENSLNRQHDGQMFDKNAALQSSLMQSQLQFQANEATKGREFQTLMADLQYKQQQGLLDAQGAQQLKQMQESSKLTNQRDELLQKYNKELTVLNNDQRWQETMFNAAQQQDIVSKQLNQQQQLQYADSQTRIMNSMTEAIGQAMSNPNMTAQQQQATIDQIRSMYQQQAAALAVVFGAKSTGGTTAPTPPGGSVGSVGSVGPAVPTNPTVQPGGGLYRGDMMPAVMP